MRRLTISIAILASLLVLAGATPRPGTYPASSETDWLQMGSRSPAGGNGFWGGHEFFVMIDLDDGYSGQPALRDSLADVGVGGTLGLSWQSVMADSSAGGLNESDVWSFVNDPLWEIAVTDGIHDSYNGGQVDGFLLRYDTLTQAGRDSITSLGPSGGDANDQWIKDHFGVDPVSYIVDGYPMSWSATQIVANMGYTSYRGGQWNHPTGGRYVSYPGEANWDSYRLFDTTRDSPLYGFATYPTEDTAAKYYTYQANDPRGAVFVSDGATDTDSMKVRIDAQFAHSAANGYAPITWIFHNADYSKAYIKEAIRYIKANYDVKFGTQSEFVSLVKSKLAAKDVPADFPYGQIAIGDTIGYFYGPTDSAIPAATDSLLAYYHAQGQVDTTGGKWPNRVISGHTSALLSPKLLTVRPGTGNSGMILGDFPLANNPDNERLYIVNWDVATDLSGKTITRATLGYRPENTIVDFADASQNKGWLGILLIDNPLLLEHWADNEQTFAYSVGTTPWTVSPDSFVVNLPYRHDTTNATIHSFYDSRKMSTAVTAFQTETSGSFIERDVTELVRKAVEDELGVVSIAFGGESHDANYTIWYQGALIDSNVDNRMYLKVWYAD